MSTFNFGELLTDKELQQAVRIHDNIDALTTFFEERMAHINKVTGQENDARYFAYAFQYVISMQKRED